MRFLRDGYPGRVKARPACTGSRAGKNADRRKKALGTPNRGGTSPSGPRSACGTDPGRIRATPAGEMTAPGRVLPLSWRLARYFHASPSGAGGAGRGDFDSCGGLLGGRDGKTGRKEPFRPVGSTMRRRCVLPDNEHGHGGVAQHPVAHTAHDHTGKIAQSS